MVEREIRKALVEIASIGEERGDDETAHSLEDDLHIAFIRFVADKGQSRPALSRLAQLVLTSGDIKFARWCS